MGEAVKVVAKNSKAYHDYFVEEKFEAGIELAGTEVKSIRLGNVNLKDSFCIIKEGQLSVLVCTSVHMKRATFLIRTPAGPAGCLCTGREILRLSGRDPAGRLLPHPPVRLFQGPTGQTGAGACQGQEAL